MEVGFTLRYLWFALYTEMPQASGITLPPACKGKADRAQLRGMCPGQCPVLDYHSAADLKPKPWCQHKNSRKRVESTKAQHTFLLRIHFIASGIYFNHCS